MMLRVLIVDDEAAIRRALRRILSTMDLEVVDAEDGVDAIGKLGAAGPFALVITDLRMPGADGFAVLRAVRERARATPVVILTGNGTVRDCVEAMRLGAVDFMAKPFDIAEIRQVVSAAIAPSQDPDTTPPPLARPDPQASLLGDSPGMAQVLDLVERVAETDATVLLSGESGTGKEVVARLIHASSRRAGRPLVTVNCGAIPEGLIESELFGHAKGAFTGATDRRVGRFVEADGGTLFLDEIGELPLAMQVRLLRVLQEREVQPVGGGATQSLDIRIIAATNRDLEAMVAAGTFRDDLYYRLSVMPIPLPPLRARGQDIAILARHFLEAAERRLGRHAVFSEDALAVMKQHSWPGNVRELVNLVERLAILDRDGVINVEDLPERMRAGNAAPAGAAAAAPQIPDGGIDLPDTLMQLEKSLVEQAMRKAEGNRTRAADLLGINRTTLVEKLKRLSRDGG